MAAYKSGMRKEEIRLRLARFLNGSRNVEDLNRLFNWLRSRSHGKHAIKEIGDFAAHQDKREKGMSWQRARHVFYNARLALSIIRALPGTSVQITRSDYHEGLRGSLALIGEDKVKSDLGWSMGKARQTLEGAIKNSLAGRHSTTWPLQQVRLVNYLESRMTMRPAFDEAELGEALSEVLLKEHLLTEEDLARLQVQMPFVSMYVVSVMHLCEIDLRDAGTATLHAAVGSDGKIVVAMHLPDVVPKIAIGTPLFMTNCDPAEWCHPGCEADFTKIFTWTEPIELDELGRLKEMT